jgi:YidC/Oxa1 family membrane protein insertase
MMKLYREHGINPAGQLFTCLPMVIQMPIWIALFLSLSNNILMRHEPAFFGLLWIDDLTAQDALYTFATPLVVPGVGWHIVSFNLLPLLVAVFMYLQQKTQPKAPPNPNATPEQRSQQEMMQKMMPMMSIMMLFIFYNMPAGLNLYIMCSSLFGWIEQKRIRAHIKEQEDNGTFDKPSGGEDGGGGLMSKLAGRKKDGSPGWLQKIQDAAEKAQKTQIKHQSGKSRKS